MPRPRIVKETKRAVEERAPPAVSSLEPHPWLSQESLTEFKRRLRSGRPFDAYLSATAAYKIKTHAEKEAQSRLEVMGFMLGEASTWRGMTYCVVMDIATTRLKSSSSKVRFDPEAFPKLFHGLDEMGFDYVLAGWYHSHPGHTCFLSQTDLETQRMMFDQEYHIALVIDPVNTEIKVFKLSEGGYDEVPFAVFFSASGKGRPDGRPPRTRKLKIAPAAN